MRRESIVVQAASIVLSFTLWLAAWPTHAGADCDTAVHPRGPEDWIARADCRRESGDPAGALADYQEAAKPPSTDSRALHYGLGRTYEDLDQHGAALEAFLKAEALGSPDADLLFHVGLAYENLADYEMALLYFRKAIVLDPRDNRSQRNIGFVLTQQGQHEVAVPFFKEAIRIDARDHKAWLNLGVTYFKIEEKLREDLKRLSFGSPSGRVDPSEPITARMNELRSKLSGFAWFDEAMAALREAVRLAPTEPVYWYTLGTRLGKRQESLSEAVEALSKAVSLNPGYYAALRNLTLYQERLERYSDAHETAIQLERVAGPRDMWLQVHLAGLESKLGEWDAAEKRYQRALATNPSDVDAHMGLAIAYRQQERQKESAEHLQRAIALRPDLKNMFEQVVEHGP